MNGRAFHPWLRRGDASTDFGAKLDVDQSLLSAPLSSGKKCGFFLRETDFLRKI
jgi:hypothetical protein